MKSKTRVTVFREGKPIKCGIVARANSTGVFVWDPQNMADAPEKAEWFPFRSRMLEVK